MLITYKILLKVSGNINLAFPGKPPLLISITFNLCDVYFNRRFVSHIVLLFYLSNARQTMFVFCVKMCKVWLYIVYTFVRQLTGTKQNIRLCCQTMRHK